MILDNSTLRSCCDLERTDFFSSVFALGGGGSLERTDLINFTL